MSNVVIRLPPDALAISKREGGGSTQSPAGQLLVLPSSLGTRACFSASVPLRAGSINTETTTPEASMPAPAMSMHRCESMCSDVWICMNELATCSGSVSALRIIVPREFGKSNLQERVARVSGLNLMDKSWNQRRKTVGSSYH